MGALKGKCGEGVSVPLRGFRGLQAFHRSDEPDFRPVFQSPCGVLGVCRPTEKDLMAFFGLGVSVPLRGFRGLQDVANDIMMDRYPEVSVPLRGFRGLQDFMADVTGFVDLKFQSPCGVLGVCRAS